MSTNRPIGFWGMSMLVIVSIAIVGYFVGIQSPMNPVTRNGLPAASPLGSHFSTSGENSGTSGAIPAPTYSQLANMDWGAANRRKTSLTDLPKPPTVFDPNQTLTITPQQKDFALAMRDRNRAFNGAPPTVPHPIDQMSAESCMACHGEGVQTESLRISKMSHQFLTNCTQCHVESISQNLTPVEFAESTFVGLPAPSGGLTAYAGAPPQIPHSTWMRVNCTSCHGFTGQVGLQTTHPWRQNCQQCHAPTSALDQIQLETEPRFLDPPNIDQ